MLCQGKCQRETYPQSLESRQTNKRSKLAGFPASSALKTLDVQGTKRGVLVPVLFVSTMLCSVEKSTRYRSFDSRLAKNFLVSLFRSVVHRVDIVGCCMHASAYLVSARKMPSLGSRQIRKRAKVTWFSWPFC